MKYGTSSINQIFQCVGKPNCKFLNSHNHRLQLLLSSGNAASPYPFSHSFRTLPQSSRRLPRHEPELYPVLTYLPAPFCPPFPPSHARCTTPSIQIPSDPSASQAGFCPITPPFKRPSPHISSLHYLFKTLPSLATLRQSTAPIMFFSVSSEPSVAKNLFRVLYVFLKS